MRCRMRGDTWLIREYSKGRPVPDVAPLHLQAQCDQKRRLTERVDSIQALQMHGCVSSLGSDKTQGPRCTRSKQRNKGSTKVVQGAVGVGREKLDLSPRESTSKEVRRKVKLQKVGSWRRKKPPVNLSGTSSKTSILIKRFIY